MSPIKINICDFWDTGNDPSNNFFVKFLSRYFPIEISDNPDFIIYSCFGQEFMKYDCTRIYYTPENIRPNFNECDYALTFDYSDHPRNFRLPLYILSAMDTVDDLSLLIYDKDRDPEKIAAAKTRFCSFIYTNNRPKYRKKLFKELSKYKPIEAPGKVLRNTDALEILDKKFANEEHPWRKSKLTFLGQSKFDIAFENESYPGYQTEKIIDSFLSDSIPIYWGSPLVSKDFNPKSIINAHDYANLQELIERVKEVDNNDQMYLDMVAEPIFKNNEIPENLRLETIVGWFKEMFETDRTPIAQTASKLVKAQSHFYHFYGKYAEKAYNRMIGRTKNFK